MGLEDLVLQKITIGQDRATVVTSKEFKKRVLHGD
jgi:hypothetical protein